VSAANPAMPQAKLPPAVDEMLRMRLRRIDAKLDAGLRGVYSDPSLFAYPQRLLLQRFQAYSPQQEDGILVAILRVAGPGSETFVELGLPEAGSHCAILARELGWAGLVVDEHEHRVERIRWIMRGDAVDLRTAPTAADALEAVRRFVARHEQDVLAIGAPFGGAPLLRDHAELAPRVVSVPCNPLLADDVSMHVERVAAEPSPSPEDLERTEAWLGTSVAGIEAIATARGYRLVCLSTSGSTAFLLRNDVAGEISALPPARARDIVWRELETPPPVRRAELEARKRCGLLLRQL